METAYDQEMIHSWVVDLKYSIHVCVYGVYYKILILFEISSIAELEKYPTLLFILL